MRLRSSLLLSLPLLTIGCNAEPGGPSEPVGTAEEALTVCPGATTLEGIDVSHYDGTIDWAAVKASGRSFAIAKATEGTTYVDPMFATNWAAMAQHGVARSAYHFFHANMDPIAEADHFLSVMGPLSPGDLPPTLDLEVTDSQSGAVITQNTIAWLDHIAAATGMKPILYTSPSFVTGTLGSPAGLENHAILWVANWGVSCPDVPAPFTSWTFWQKSSTGTVPGISGSGNVDLDVFDGSLTDLMALGKPSSSSSSTTSSTTGTTSATSATSAAASGSSGATGAATSGATTGPGSTTTGAGAGGSSGTGGTGPTGAPGRSGCSCTAAGSSEGSTGAALLAGLALTIGARRSRRRFSPRAAA